MARQLSIWLSLGLAVALLGCEDQPAQQADEPPEWIKEAHERSRQHREQQQAAAEPPQRTYEPEPEPRAIERSSLWRVDGPNGPLYLFGTLHGGLSDISWDDLPPDVHEAFTESHTVVLEADASKINKRAVSRLGTLPRRDSLRQILGERRFDKLSMAVDAPPRVVDRMQPWMAYTMLAGGMLGDGKSVDEIVKLEARVMDKRLAYLETVQSQIDLLRDQIDASLLSAVIDKINEMNEQTRRLIESYRAGDIEGLEESIFRAQQAPSHSELYDELFEKRNRAWMPAIEDHLEHGYVFVAVGAGHLVGDVSVVRMLEEKGHEVERVGPADDEPADDEPAGDEPSDDEPVDDELAEDDSK